MPLGAWNVDAGAGKIDVWTLMHNPLSRATRAESTDPTLGTTEEVQARRPLGRRRWIVGSAAAALALGGVGIAVAADAHKTVSLDVDGKIIEVDTWAGSVSNLLDELGIETGERDVVAPAASSALDDGDAVVVRYGREVTVSDGEGSESVWTTALDAAEVLDSLEQREAGVHLVASRSAERTEIGVRLPLDEAVQVLVEGEVRPVAAGVASVDAALAAADVELGELDEVLVAERSADGHEVAAGETGVVTVVVRRVEVTEKASTKKIAHTTETVKDSSRYTDQPTIVRTAGKDGVRTTVHRIRTVDGDVVEKEKISEKVTKKPVTEVKVVGTKKRPVVTPSTPSSSGSSSSTPSKAQGTAPSGTVWARLAQCESGGRANAVSPSGAYHGLYQFSVSTWRSVGGSGLPSQASAAEQTKRAKILQARSGWGQWPHCSAKLGLR